MTGQHPVLAQRALQPAWPAATSVRQLWIIGLVLLAACAERPGVPTYPPPPSHRGPVPVPPTPPQPPPSIPDGGVPDLLESRWSGPAFVGSTHLADMELSVTRRDSEVTIRGSLAGRGRTSVMPVIRGEVDDQGLARCRPGSCGVGWPLGWLPFVRKEITAIRIEHDALEWHEVLTTDEDGDGETRDVPLHAFLERVPR